MQKQFDDMAMSGNVVGRSGLKGSVLAEGWKRHKYPLLPPLLYIIDFSLMQRDISECEVHSTPLIE